MRIFLAFILVGVFSCSSKSTESTSSLPALNPFAALDSAFDARDEEIVHPGDSAAEDTPVTAQSVVPDSAYHGEPDFAPGAAGDPLSPEEEEYQRKVDEAQPLFITPKPLDEHYFTSTLNNEYVTYTLRIDEGYIEGFCFPLLKGDTISDPIEIRGIREANGKFHFNELATDGKTSSVVQGSIENGNLIGTRSYPNQSTTEPFQATLIGPQPHDLVYRFMYKIIDNVPTLFEVTVSSDKSKFWQQVTPNNLAISPKMRAITLDANLDGHMDFVVPCPGDGPCDGQFFIYQPTKKRFTLHSVNADFNNIWMDYSNKRMLSIAKQKGTSTSKVTLIPRLDK